MSLPRDAVFADFFKQELRPVHSDDGPVVLFERVPGQASVLALVREQLEASHHSRTWSGSVSAACAVARSMKALRHITSPDFEKAILAIFPTKPKQAISSAAGFADAVVRVAAQCKGEGLKNLISASSKALQVLPGFLGHAFIYDDVTRTRLGVTKDVVKFAAAFERRIAQPCIDTPNGRITVDEFLGDEASRLALSEGKNGLNIPEDLFQTYLRRRVFDRVLWLSGLAGSMGGTHVEYRG